ncbi:hypothetical protein SDJN02_05037 [Cucurbita argyrosperma subsp. argyrosperma]|nr:hypothetical protein SDJN02_05037 [Cucurbita argyrosperma subsp. argyrosperma]
MDPAREQRNRKVEALSNCNFSTSKLNLNRVTDSLRGSCFSSKNGIKFNEYHYLPHRQFNLADEEPVDQKRYLEEACKPKCVKPLLEYQACVKRIQGDDSGHKHCTGQYFDYWSCVDKCVAPKLFTKIK